MGTKRRLGNWMAGWEKFTSELPTPTLWKTWGGIGIISAALERKVWVRTRMGQTYANMYIILCGPPGVGKTVISSRVNEYLSKLRDLTNPERGLHLASASVTFASLIDELLLAKRDIVRLDMEPSHYEFNSLSIVSNEMGTLLPEYDTNMMPKLTELWDGHPYSEHRRGRNKQDVLQAPLLNLFAACTPGYLTATIPPGAWDQGFLARCMIAFSSENLYQDIFTESELDRQLAFDLTADLQLIFSPDETFGEITFDDSALDAIRKWALAGCPPKPEHPRLINYSTRRLAQVMKLCIIASVAESSSMKITKEHFAAALDWVLELEIHLPEIFKAMVVGGDAQAMEECWFYFLDEYTRKQRSIPEQRVVAYLGQRLPAYSVVRVLDIMVRSGLMKEEYGDGLGKAYVPKARKLL